MEKVFELKNEIDPVVYNKFRDKVGWGALTPEQAEAVLSNCICFSFVHGEETAAITRVLWDGGYTAYIADVIVDEKYRGQGLGKKLVNHALEEIKNRMRPGWKVKVLLLASKGRESFYEQFGFVSRPNENEGCGMNLVIKKD